MDSILFFITLVALVVVTQALVAYIHDKTKQVFLSLLPNVGLLALGLVLSTIGYFVALNEPGNWADLGLIIMLMITVISTTISTLISLLLVFVIKPIRAKSSTNK